MKTIISSLAAAAVMAMAAPAQADGPRFGPITVQIGHGQAGYGWHGGYRAHPLEGLNEINARQANQRDRIERGFHMGSINRWEFRSLMAEQHDIQAMERAFVADGFLTPRERMELNRRLDIASANIRFEATDYQRRF
jgi:hypothetical protein